MVSRKAASREWKRRRVGDDPRREEEHDEIDRKNMLNRYSKIAWNSSSDRPMNSNPPRNRPKRPDPEDGAAEQDHREPQPRARQAARRIVFRVRRQRSRRKARAV